MRDIDFHVNSIDVQINTCGRPAGQSHEEAQESQETEWVLRTGIGCLTWSQSVPYLTYVLPDSASHKTSTTSCGQVFSHSKCIGLCMGSTFCQPAPP